MHCDVTLRRISEASVSMEVLHVSLHVRARLIMCLHACVSVGAQARACACIRVSILIQHATHMRCIVYGLSGSTSFDMIS
jgi:hypothetical protein